MGSLEARLQHFEVLAEALERGDCGLNVHVAESIGVASWALDGPQLSCRPGPSTASWWASCGHTLSTRWWSTIGLWLSVIVAAHSCVLSARRPLWWLLLRWSSVTVVAWCWPRGASRKAWESVAVEHVWRLEVVIELENVGSGVCHVWSWRRQK